LFIKLPSKRREQCSLDRADNWSTIAGEWGRKKNVAEFPKVIYCRVDSGSGALRWSKFQFFQQNFLWCLTRMLLWYN